MTITCHWCSAGLRVGRLNIVVFFSHLHVYWLVHVRCSCLGSALRRRSPHAWLALIVAFHLFVDVVVDVALLMTSSASMDCPKTSSRAKPRNNNNKYQQNFNLNLQMKTIKLINANWTSQRAQWLKSVSFSSDIYYTHASTHRCMPTLPYANSAVSRCSGPLLNGFTSLHHQ